MAYPQAKDLIQKAEKMFVL